MDSKLRSSLIETSCACNVHCLRFFSLSIILRSSFESNHSRRKTWSARPSLFLVSAIKNLFKCSSHRSFSAACDRFNAKAPDFVEGFFFVVFVISPKHLKTRKLCKRPPWNLCSSENKLNYAFTRNLLLNVSLTGFLLTFICSTSSPWVFLVFFALQSPMAT